MSTHLLSSNIIVTRGLRKTYGETVAVQDLSIAVKGGTTTALLGGNGAGKTTIISMLLGLLLPTSGQIEILGHDMLEDRFSILPRINFSSPYVDLPFRLTVRQNLRVYAQLYGIKNAADRVLQLSNDLELTSFLDRMTGKLSAGQKTRVVLAKSLINAPDVLFLDEPTASLDPDTGDWVRKYLMQYQNETGATILLASHNMSEVERMASHVLMMRSGELVDKGSPSELLKRYGRANMEDVFLDIARDRTDHTLAGKAL